MNDIFDEINYLLDNYIDKEKVNSVIKIENINDEVHYYIICKNKKDKIEIKHFITNDKISLENKKSYNGTLFLTGGEIKIRTLIDHISEYNVNKCGLPVCSKRKGPKFYIGLLHNDTVYSFDKKNTNVDYIYFYDLANYLLIYSGFEKNQLFTNVKDDSIMCKAVELDNEIAIFMKKHETGRKNSLELKLNKEWKNTDFTKKCKDLTSKMNNYELINTIIFTEYLCQVGDSVDLIKKEIINNKLVKNDSKYRKTHLYRIVNFMNYVYSLRLPEELENKIIERLGLNEIIDLILSSMTNKEINDEIHETSDFNVKLKLMQYIKEDKEYIMQKHINNMSSKLPDYYKTFRENPSKENYFDLIDCLCRSRVFIPIGDDKNILFLIEDEKVYVPIFDNISYIEKDSTCYGAIEYEFDEVASFIVENKLSVDGILLNYVDSANTVEFPTDLIIDMKANIEKGIYSVNMDIIIRGYEILDNSIDDNLVALSYSLSKDPHEIKDLIGKDLFAYLDKNYKEMNFEPGMIGEFDYSNGNYIVCYKKHIVSIINNEIHCNNQEILREKANKIYKLMQ